VIKTPENYRMYFSISKGGVYTIKTAVSDDCLKFETEKRTVIDVNENHSKAAHSPKVVNFQGKYYCYYTGSNDSRKIYSKKYANYDVGKDFRIFLSTSDDGIKFDLRGRISSIEELGLMNYYGHSTAVLDGDLHLFFTGFDGNVNRIYATKSADGVDFERPEILLAPDEENDVVGLYSCAVNPLDNDILRIYYGARRLDNRWIINSALLGMESD